MQWFRLYHDLPHDRKLQRFSVAQKWAWVVLLCMASESKERGKIIEDEQDVADYCGFDSLQDYQFFIDKLRQKGMIEAITGGLQIVNWEARQYTKPSDQPAAARERKRRQRANQSALQAEGVPRDIAGQGVMSRHPDPDSDSEQSQKQNNRSLSNSPAPESAPERARAANAVPEADFRAYVTSRLRPTCKGNLIAYVNTALKHDRDTWLTEYHRHLEKRDIGDSGRDREMSKPDFAVHPLAGIGKSSASPADLALRCDNFRRAWDASPNRRTQLEALLSGQPELGLFVLDGELCEFGSEVAA
jgi:hypothetical protein